MILKFGHHVIEMYSTIHELPVLRFQRFNKYQMMASEIGNTFEDYDRRTIKALQFIKKKMNDEALQELENRRQAVFNAYNEFSPRLKAMAILVKKIDNTDYNEFSPDSVDECIKHLDRIGFPYEKSISELSNVKKKSKQNWLSIIQDTFLKMGIGKKRLYVLSA